MKKFLPALVLFISFSIWLNISWAQAPTASWLIGSTGSAGIGDSTILQDNVGGMHCDSIGNTYIYGALPVGNISFGSIYINNTSKNAWLYITKINSAGKAQWAKPITSTGRVFPGSISVNAEGYFVITGNITNGKINFNSQDTILAGSTQFFVAGYDPNGNLLWVTTPSAGNNWVSGTFINANRMAYATGYFEDQITIASKTYNAGNGRFGVYTMQLNPSGHVEWFKTGTNSSGTSSGDKVIEQDGVVYAAGYVTDSLNFNGAKVYGNNAWEFYLTKYDTAGNQLWVKNIGGSEDIPISMNGMGIDSSNSIYISCITEGGTLSALGSAEFGSYELPSGYYGTGFIFKCSPAGDVLWADCVNDENGAGIYNIASVNHYCSIVAVGYFGGGYISIGNSNGVLDSVMLGPATNQGFMISFAPDGTPQWEKLVGGDYFVNPSLVDIQPNGISVAGIVSDSIRMDGLSFSSRNTTQVFLGRFNYYPAGISTVSNPASNWNIFPNPAHDFLTVDHGNNRYSTLRIADLSGRVLMEEPFNSQLPLVSTGRLSAGIYLLSLQDEAGTVSSKLFVKE